MIVGVAPSWLPVYWPRIQEAGEAHGIDPLLLCAVMEQESNGGNSPRTGLPDPRQLYRYEPAFWDRYLRANKDYQPPKGCETGRPLELWKRRVSASYGHFQVMFATARDFGLPKTSDPEALYDFPTCARYACLKLAHEMKRANGELRQALARYNGARTHQVSDYDEKVLERYARFKVLTVSQ